MRAVSRKIKIIKKRQQLLQIEVEGTGVTFSALLLKKAIEEIQAEMQMLQQLYEELKRRGPRKGAVITSSTGHLLDRVFQENPIETIEK